MVTSPRPDPTPPGLGPSGLQLALSRFGAGPLLAFWLLIVAILVLPIALFLLVAFSPRLFDQGSAWFTLSGSGRRSPGHCCGER